MFCFFLTFHFNTSSLDNINYTGVNYERGDSGKAAMNATERCNASSSNDLQSSNNFHTESVLYESVVSPLN